MFYLYDKHHSKDPARIVDIRQSHILHGVVPVCLSSWDYSSSEVSPFLGNFDGTYKFVNGLCV